MSIWNQRFRAAGDVPDVAFPTVPVDHPDLSVIARAFADRGSAFAVDHHEHYAGPAPTDTDPASVVLPIAEIPNLLQILVGDDTWTPTADELRDVATIFRSAIDDSTMKAVIATPYAIRVANFGENNTAIVHVTVGGPDLEPSEEDLRRVAEFFRESVDLSVVRATVGYLTERGSWHAEPTSDDVQIASAEVNGTLSTVAVSKTEDGRYVLLGSHDLVVEPRMFWRAPPDAR